jgi:hypothetical protein
MEDGGTVLTVLLDWRGRRDTRWSEGASSLLHHWM